MKIPDLSQKLLNFDLNYGRSHVQDWCRAYFRDHAPAEVRVLDIGCSWCTDLKNIRNIATCPVTLLGIEVNERYVPGCTQAGVTVFPINIERDDFPVGDRDLDIIILNQVLEHTKEIFFIFSEISRVLKPGGIVILGVPNLAALHNRLLLILGRQPTNIEVLGPHVRGFTISSLKKFIETGGYFQVTAVRGTHFYGLPVPLSTWLARLFPGGSASIYLLAARTEKEGRFIEVLKATPFETNFYPGHREGGPSDPSGD
ncbi:MAG: methionine biosynthesis protein MetW [Methanomicrobiales archaeon]|nr:methionine biosynthesis protein MetW [Methanomicrobiales archaeon]